MEPGNDARDALLSARNVGWRWSPADAPRVTEVSLDVTAGRCVGVLGPNGAGKSTLLRLLAGLLAPTTGAVLLRGERVSAMSPAARARAVAWLPQDERVPDELTVRELVSLGRAPHTDWLGVMTDVDERAVARALDACELVGLVDRAVRTLSGGEQKRALLARAFAQGASVLLLDEPMAALDLRHQVAVCRLLRRAATDDGVGVVMVLHDVNLAARACDEVVLLRDGAVVARGAPGEVLDRARLEATFETELSASRADDGGWCWVPRL